MNSFKYLPLGTEPEVEISPRPSLWTICDITVTRVQMNRQQQKASPGWRLLYFACSLSAYGPYLMWLRFNISLLSYLQCPAPCLMVKAAQWLSSMIICCGSRVGGFSWVVITWVFQPVCSWSLSGFKGFLAHVWLSSESRTWFTKFRAKWRHWPFVQ